MSRPQGHRDTEFGEPNSNMGWFTFVTVTSGNPVTVYGSGITVTRASAGNYDVTINGTFTADSVVGLTITDAASSASKNYNVHQKGISTKSGGSTTWRITVLDGTTETDGAGALVVQGLWLGVQAV